MADHITITYSTKGIPDARQGAYERVIAAVYVEAARRTVQDLQRTWPRRTGTSAAAFAAVLRAANSEQVRAAVVNVVPYAGDIHLKGEQGVHAAIVEPLFAKHLQQVVDSMQDEIAAAATADALRGLKRR